MLDEGAAGRLLNVRISNKRLAKYCKLAVLSFALHKDLPHKIGE